MSTKVVRNDRSWGRRIFSISIFCIWFASPAVAGDVAPSPPVLFDGQPQPTTGDPLSYGLVQEEDWSYMVSYLGTVRAPPNFDYGGLGWHVNNGTVYASGNYAASEGFGAFSLPSIGGQGNLITSVRSIPGSIGVSGTYEKPSGSIVYKNRLYIVRHAHYDGDGVQNRNRNWIVSCDLLMTNCSSINRMSPNRNGEVRGLAGNLIHIPAAWQPILGGPVGVVASQSSLVQSVANGYGLGVFDPSDVSMSGSDVPVDVLLYYPFDDPIEPIAGTPEYAPYNAAGGNDLFNVNTAIVTAFIPEGSRSLLFVAVHGYGRDGGQSNCRNGSSVHTGPYRLQVVAYDLRDLVRVKEGTLGPSDVRPYDWWRVTPGSDSGPLRTCVDIRDAGSGGFDTFANRLYVFERFLIDDGAHVWQIGPLAN